MKFKVGDVLMLRTIPNGWNHFVSKNDIRKCEVTKIENSEYGETNIYLSTEFGDEVFYLYVIEEMLIEYIPTSLENV